MAIAIALFVLPGVVHGCSSPTAPAKPPGGGVQLDLSYDQFVAKVSPVLEQHGCDATSGGDCHGGGIQGTLELSPPTAKNLRFDFDQVVLQASAYTPDQSPILTKPLEIAAGGTPHPFKAFTTTGDSGYVAIRQWIEDGVTP